MEGRFLTSLEVRWLPDDGTAELLKELVYQSASLRAAIVVPKGFVTDFASVPRLPITFALTGDTAHEAAVVHDYLYQTHRAGGCAIERAQADGVFLEAMEATGIPWWRRRLMWSGVRIGGWGSWRSGPTRFKILNE